VGLGRGTSVPEGKADGVGPENVNRTGDASLGWSLRVAMQMKRQNGVSWGFFCNYNIPLVRAGSDASREQGSKKCDEGEGLHF